MRAALTLGLPNILECIAASLQRQETLSSVQDDQQRSHSALTNFRCTGGPISEYTFGRGYEVVISKALARQGGREGDNKY